MSWPLASHFSAMVQNPRVAFRDPYLQRVVIEKDARNQPRPWAGAFAVVYKASDPQRQDPFAVRVFTSESPERRERYELISQYLRGRKVRCLCEFEYRERSIRSAGDGKWYPLILMEWVQGETLFKWVRAQCLRRDGAAIAKAADRWIDVMKQLAEAQVAHGDLQHGNVMVTEAGELKLVDYDCMCVPALVGRRNLEIGVEPYQHPQRNDRTLLSLDLDNYSASFIYVALKALAWNPDLWGRYIESSGYDKLLFRREDLLQPATSPLMRELAQSPDRELRDLLQQFLAFVPVPMDQVPPVTQLVNSYAKVEHLLQQRRWAEAVDLLNKRGHFRDAPAHLKGLIREAYEQVCREQAWKSFSKLPTETSEANDRALVDAWNEPLFEGFEPAEKQRPRVAEARQRVAIIDRLRHYLQQLSGRITLAGEQALYEAASKLPPGYQYSLAERIEETKRRLIALKRFAKVLKAPPSEAAIVAAWRAVSELKCQRMIDANALQRVELAGRRAPLLKQLAELPAELPVGERDKRLLELWDDALLGDCADAEKLRPQYVAACGRRDAVERLRQAAAGSVDADVLAAAADPALEGYPLPDELLAAVEHRQKRLTQMAALQKALAEGDAAGIAEAFDVRLVRDHPDVFGPLREPLGHWIVGHLLDPAHTGLKPQGRTSVEPVEGGDGAYQLRWQWPEQQFADRCLVCFSPTPPTASTDPTQFPAEQTLVVDRAGWEAGGGGCLVNAQPAWQQWTAAVWAVIDVGLETHYSGPVVLGTLRGRKGWGFSVLGLFGRGKKAKAETPDDGEATEEVAETSPPKG